MNNQYGSYVDVISKLDVEYKKDLLSDVRLNERDLLADRVFYPTVPDHWAGKRPNFLDSTSINRFIKKEFFFVMPFKYSKKTLFYMMLYFLLQ